MREAQILPLVGRAWKHAHTPSARSLAMMDVFDPRDTTQNQRQHPSVRQPVEVTKATPMAHSTHTFVTLGRVSNGNPAIRGHTSKNTGCAPCPPPPRHCHTSTQHLGAAIKTAAAWVPLSQLMTQFNNNLSSIHRLVRAQTPEKRLTGKVPPTLRYKAQSMIFTLCALNDICTNELSTHLKSIRKNPNISLKSFRNCGKQF